MRIREPAVAGLFYPESALALDAEVSRYLRGGPALAGPAPKALIAPHAGYVYSGAIAGRAYRAVAGRRATIRRVVLLGPSHRVALAGLALPDAGALRTPLGNLQVDTGAIARIIDLPGVHVLERAHAHEHSLEVHLPFLQTLFGNDVAIVPLVVGRAGPPLVAEVLEALWGGNETLVVISSDLSHYHDYATARALDAATSAAIERLDHAAIGPQDACGFAPIGGLLEVARRRGLAVSTLELANSGDTAGPRDRVVGYGAYAVA